MGRQVCAQCSFRGSEGHSRALGLLFWQVTHIPFSNIVFLSFFFCSILKVARSRVLYLSSILCVWKLILGTSWGNESCLWPPEGAAGVREFHRKRINQDILKSLCWWLSSKRCLLWFISQPACMWSFRFNDCQNFWWGQRKLFGSGFYFSSFSSKKDMLNMTLFFFFFLYVQAVYRQREGFLLRLTANT